jgi:hypothetical protein
LRIAERFEEVRTAFLLEVGANGCPPPPNGFRALAAGKNFDIKTVTFSINF